MRKVGSRIAITLTLVAMTWTVSSQQVKRSIGSSDAPRIERAAPADATTLATRQRFLEMFARAYFPGRTGQLLIVPREGEFITRPDPDVAYMHGSPWAYDVSIPLMFAGPAVRTGGTRCRPCSRTLRQRLRLRWVCQCLRLRQAEYCRSCGLALLDRALSSCSFWMACDAITSIGTPM